MYEILNEEFRIYDDSLDVDYELEAYEKIIKR